MHVTGDRQICVGAGQCVLASPDVFDQDDDHGLVLVLQSQPGEHQRDAVNEAANTCPSGAIQIA